MFGACLGRATAGGGKRAGGCVRGAGAGKGAKGGGAPSTATTSVGFAGSTPGVATSTTGAGSLANSPLIPVSDCGSAGRVGDGGGGSALGMGEFGMAAGTRSGVAAGTRPGV